MGNKKSELVKLNKAVREKFAEDGNFFKNSKIKDITADKSLQEELKTSCESLISSQLKEFILMQYLLMEKTGDFTTLGEQRVSISFCRHLLQIPPSRDVTQLDADFFKKQVVRWTEKWRINNIEDLNHKIGDCKIKIFDSEFELHRHEIFNDILGFLGSDKRLFIGHFENQPAIVFGNTIEKKLGDITVYFFQNEDVRSPHFTLAVAGIARRKTLAIRRESILTIFYNKWLRSFRFSEEEGQKVNHNLESNIREKIKKHIYKLYDVKSHEDLNNIRDEFVKDETEQIHWHEIGHLISESSLYTEDQKGMVSALMGLGYNIVYFLDEFFADFAPKIGKMKGALEFISELAIKKNMQKKAEQMLFVYISDNWFFEYDQSPLAKQSILLISIILPYINEDLGVDFQKLYTELLDVESNENTFHHKVWNMLNETLDGVYEIFSKSTFKISDQSLPYQVVSLIAEYAVMKDYPELTKDDRLFKKAYWSLLLNNLRNFSNASYQDILRLVDNLERKIFELVRKNVYGNKSGEFKELLFSKFKQLGLQDTAKKLNSTEALQLFASELGYPKSMSEPVLSQFTEIISGKSKRLVLNYEGEADPFVSFLQRLIQITGLGAIKNGMCLEHPLLLQEGGKKKKEEVFVLQMKKLQKIIDDKRVLRIAELRLNPEFITEEKALEVLNDVKSKEKSNMVLADHIQRWEIYPMPSGRVAEAFFPVEYGFVCWNTLQSVSEINRRYLNKKTEGQMHMVTKEFIELLVDYYLKMV